MSLVVDFALVAAAVVALWFGARWLVGAAAALARAANVPPLVIGLTVIAFGTSAPEFAVSVDAALVGRPDVSVGNVVGSNVFNLGFLLGVLALLRPFRVTDALVRRDALAMGAATGVALAVLADLTVSRAEGALLVALLVAYLAALVRAARSESSDDPAVDGGPARPDAPSLDDDRRRPLAVEAGVLLVGLALVAAGGDLLVDAAGRLALDAGVSEWLVGVTVVAVGTSLPEAAASLVAARRAELGIAAGNIVGSNVLNLLGVLGVAALLRPMHVAADAVLGLGWLFVLTAVATALLATGRRLTRPEGAALVATVVAYWVVTAG
ncbi:calcium/sodium antiporter [Salinilacihabitans rarus]|uniref:calcium/sodium antiporter n=1 Tax=Salinilacihabitans rarus TaxID=2961596 RepID=UPI0020C88B42|nr:calcium/sodium antiporter [Salinilacihabitans rarus]